MHTIQDHIHSKTNPKIKHICHLRKKRARDLSNEFLIEGYREIKRGVNQPIEQLFFCPELFLGSNEDLLIEEIGKKAKLFQVDREVFMKISYRDRPDGLLAVATKQIHALKALPKGDFYLLIEGVEKPGNLGTILRTCDGFGVDGVLLCDPGCDPYNPNTIRASLGALFTVPWAQTSSQNALLWLQKNKICPILATPEAEQSLFHTDLKQPVCLIFGSEQYGLSSFWRGADHMSAQIPLCGDVDSLNLAVAAVLFMYETKRQRS